MRRLYKKSAISYVKHLRRLRRRNRFLERAKCQNRFAILAFCPLFPIPGGEAAESISRVNLMLTKNQQFLM
jgi:hypothetical protein